MDVPTVATSAVPPGSNPSRSEEAPTSAARPFSGLVSVSVSAALRGEPGSGCLTAAMTRFGPQVSGLVVSGTGSGPPGAPSAVRFPPPVLFGGGPGGNGGAFSIFFDSDSVFFFSFTFLSLFGSPRRAAAFVAPPPAPTPPVRLGGSAPAASAAVTAAVYACADWCPPPLPFQFPLPGKTAARSFPKPRPRPRRCLDRTVLDSPISDDPRTRFPPRLSPPPPEAAMLPCVPRKFESPSPSLTPKDEDP